MTSTSSISFRELHEREDGESYVYMPLTPHTSRLCKAKNHTEVVLLDIKTREYDQQAKSLTRMWDKETKQLQGHLQKLEQEKFSLHKQTDAGHGQKRHTEDETCRFGEGNAHEVTDPYPIVFSARANPSAGKNKHRRQSLEFEDLEINPTTGKLRSRLQSSSPLNCLPDKRSMCLHKGSASLLNMRLQQKALTWIGNPVAISSVRRDKRSPGDQRRDLCNYLLSKKSTVEGQGNAVSPNRHSAEVECGVQELKRAWDKHLLSYDALGEGSTQMRPRTRSWSTSAILKRQSAHTSSRGNSNNEESSQPSPRSAKRPTNLSLHGVKARERKVTPPSLPGSQSSSPLQSRKLGKAVAGAQYISAELVPSPQSPTSPRMRASSLDRSKFLRVRRRRNVEEHQPEM